MVFSRIITKVLGGQLLRDISAFVAALDTMFGGFRERRDATYELLRRPGTAFVVVATPEPDALREASYFVDRLSAEGMPLAGLVLNRTHPPATTAAVGRRGRRARPRRWPSPASRAPTSPRRRCGCTPSGWRWPPASSTSPTGSPARTRTSRVRTVPAAAGDVHDLDGLRAMAAELTGADDDTPTGTPRTRILPARPRRTRPERRLHHVVCPPMSENARLKSTILAKLALTIAVAGALVAGLLLPWVGGTGIVARNSASLLDALPVELTTRTPAGMTRVLAADGSLITFMYENNRPPLKSEQIADVMKQALVDIEDSRFYLHNGLDVEGTLRALARNLAAGQVNEGGSTITQQLVKQTLLQAADSEEERTAAIEQDGVEGLSRKLREARLALALEEKYTRTRSSPAT